MRQKNSGITFLSKSNQIPVLLCFDVNYANYAAVATYSAHKNSKTSLKFYWLCTPECKEVAAKLKKVLLEQSNIQVELLACDVTYFSLYEEASHEGSGYLTSASYLRLFAPDLLTKEDKVIYIDCDTIVLTDLQDLYDIELNDSRFGGVIDEFASKTSQVPRVADDKYINSGVLLMDLKGLRNDGFLERSKTLFGQYKNKMTWQDQCLINKYAEGKKTILNPKWNRQINLESFKTSTFVNFAEPQNSSILHFVGHLKPWQSWCNPYVTNFWWHYANELRISNLKPVPINQIQHLIMLAHILDLNGQYEGASRIKTITIKRLLQHSEEIKRKHST